MAFSQIEMVGPYVDKFGSLSIFLHRNEHSKWIGWRLTNTLQMKFRDYLGRYQINLKLETKICISRKFSKFCETVKRKIYKEIGISG